MKIFIKINNLIKKKLFIKIYFNLSKDIYNKRFLKIIFLNFYCSSYLFKFSLLLLSPFVIFKDLKAKSE